MLGTNRNLTRIHGPDPANTPQLLLGDFGLPLSAGTIGVFGEFVALGRPAGHAWVELAESAWPGNMSIIVDAIVTWRLGSEIVISPSDFDPHESEVHQIVSVRFNNSLNRSIIALKSEIKFGHFAESWQMYAAKRMRIRAKVGLLSRNIVIRGNGQGEEGPYTTWNTPVSTSTRESCGNGICETGESSIFCPADCLGPAFEYGASVLVSTYSETYTNWDQNGRYLGRFKRKFYGYVNISNVEFRYFGQSGIRSGIAVLDLGKNGESNVIQNTSFNRGYFGVLLIKGSRNVQFRDSTFFRSMLPSIELSGGENNTVEGILGVIGIFWSTHRGTIQVSSSLRMCRLITPNETLYCAGPGNIQSKVVCNDRNVL